MQQPWFKDAVIYSVDVRRFFDADGDGLGDFEGLTQKLDYLVDLGVTCVWLLPCHPSPEGDGGYDVADYYAVDPRLGGLEGLLSFIQRAGERGIRVLMDLVVNHTSDQHPWFQAARRSHASHFRPYYIWAQHPSSPPPGGGPMFPGEQDTVWTYDQVAGAYYHHRFYPFEPELNFGCEAVREEIVRIIDFWMSMGVAGFRLDSAAHLIANGGETEPHPADCKALLQRFLGEMRRHNPQAALMAEVDEGPRALAGYFEGGDQVSLLLNFYLGNYLFLALARESAQPIVQASRELPTPPESGAWANFLRNHDELNLAQLAPEEREEVMAAFAPDAEMRAFGRGIRRRLSSMLENADQVRLAWSVIFAFPGAPVIYYGDEIGMGEDLAAEGRLAVRTPMQWSSGRAGGFSRAATSALVQKPVPAPRYAPARVNLEAQQNDPTSLYEWLKTLIGVRRARADVINGRLDWLDGGAPEVLAQRFSDGAQTLIVLNNLSSRAVSASHSLTKGAPPKVRDLLAGTELDSSDPGLLRLEPYGCRWLFWHT
jgi:maltose alpha-D-glucosyltransferase/alpha-amylase